MRRSTNSYAFIIALLITSAAANAQRQVAPRAALPAPAAPAYDPRLYSDPGATSSRLKALQWRLVGPFRGGRVDAVVGDPTRPFVFYMGAVNGGVWKTANGGQTWWDTDLALGDRTPVQLRHDSVLLQAPVEPWGWQPRFRDLWI